jgi:hypothetical protein
LRHEAGLQSPATEFIGAKSASRYAAEADEPLNRVWRSGSLAFNTPDFRMIFNRRASCDFDISTD